MNEDFAAEPASEPVPFPEACTTVHDAVKFQCRVYNPRTQEYFVASNVIRPNHQGFLNDDGDDDSDCDASRDSGVSTKDPQVAYMIVKALQRAMVCRNEHSGMIHLARVLEHRNYAPVHCTNRSADCTARGEENDLSHYAQWELTDREVVIKELYLTRVFLNENHKQAVKNEVKAMRYIQNYSNEIQNLNHVSVPRDVLIEAGLNRRHLWMVMPYHGTRSDFHYQMTDSDGMRQALTEHDARQLFRGILSAMAEMQQMRLSHRDISAENLILDGQRCVVIDFATNIRLPYDNDQRLLVKNTQRVGKVQYMAPEMFYGSPYDGFAVDLWACAIMLFRMTSGCFPFELPGLFELPRRTNPVFRALVSNDQFRFTLACNHIRQNVDYLFPTLSPQLMDLLQRMMAEDPTERLSLRQIQNHAWMTMQI